MKVPAVSRKSRSSTGGEVGWSMSVGEKDGERLSRTYEIRNGIERESNVKSMSLETGNCVFTGTDREHTTTHREDDAVP